MQREVSAAQSDPVSSQAGHQDTFGGLQRPEIETSLLNAPLCRAEHLGRPIPDSPYAVSVAMPTWENVVDYERGTPQVVDALQAGYPRFVIKGLTAELFERFKARLCSWNEEVIAFPSRQSAERCLRYVREEFPGTGRIELTGSEPITACVVPVEAYKRARSYWQHSGEIISARWAEACMTKSVPDLSHSPKKESLRVRLASLALSDPSDVFLFPSGMAGIAAIQRTVQAASPGIRTAQVGFPYLDTLKIQEKFGAGCMLLPVTGSAAETAAEVARLDRAAARGEISAIYCEFPANPLLTVPPLARLWEISIRHKIPLIVDETLGSLANVRVLPYATAIVTSLTKYFSGEGDVCAGSVIWNPRHPAYEQLYRHWEKSFEDQLFEGDAAALEKNSRDFPRRMQQINQSTALLVEYLRSHPAIEAIYYPDQDERQKQIYDMFRVEDGGYGGLFSFRLKGGIESARQVYDALEISKGPSLGTNFTIACPYTLLAHFQELEKVAQLGVAADLIRVSVGLEDPAALIERFGRALSSLRLH